LDLSHNQITEQGATALGRALLLSSSTDGQDGVVVESLDLSNNPLGDRGALHLAAALAQGKVTNLTLRSCHIHADGAAAFGKALYALTMQQSGNDTATTSPKIIDLDLSGNPLGMLRGKVKAPGAGSKYSANRLKSTATATAASYMNRLKKGLKDSGVSDLISKSSSSGGVDSDDEEEQPGDEEEESDNDGESGGDPSQKRCGIKAFVNAFLQEEQEDEASDKATTASSGTTNDQSMVIQLGFRHCFLDHSAADALAAIQVESAEQGKAVVLLDLALNPVLEDDMVHALQIDPAKLSDPQTQSSYAMDQRLEMAERYMDTLQALRESKKRAAQARAARAQRMQQQRNRRRMEEEGSEDDDDFGQWDQPRRKTSYYDNDDRDYFDEEDDEDEAYGDEQDSDQDDWGDDDQYDY